MSSLAVDYCARQKGNLMMQYIVESLPIAAKPADSETPWGADGVHGFVLPRVAELTYTSDDLTAWGRDLGYGGSPFKWDSRRRAVLQSELDALWFHAYELDRDDVSWILDTFKVLAKYEEIPH
jgi:hypothetical protein